MGSVIVRDGAVIAELIGAFHPRPGPEDSLLLARRLDGDLANPLSLCLDTA